MIGGHLGREQARAVLCSPSQCWHPSLLPWLSQRSTRGAPGLGPAPQEQVSLLGAGEASGMTTTEHVRSLRTQNCPPSQHLQHLQLRPTRSPGLGSPTALSAPLAETLKALEALRPGERGEFTDPRLLPGLESPWGAEISWGGGHTHPAWQLGPWRKQLPLHPRQVLCRWRGWHCTDQDRSAEEKTQCPQAFPQGCDSPQPLSHWASDPHIAPLSKLLPPPGHLACASPSRPDNPRTPDPPG